MNKALILLHGFFTRQALIGSYMTGEIVTLERQFQLVIPGFNKDDFTIEEWDFYE